MKIERIRIQNFKNIESFDELIDGRYIYLTGGNETGKTSFIQSVFCGLTGKDVPPEPVMKGKREGEVELDLGDIIATTTFKRGKAAQLKIVDKSTGEAIKSPRTYLNSRVGILDFDLNKFFLMSNLEQVKYFAKIVGDDFSDIDSEIQELMEGRKVDKREMDNLSSQTGFYKNEDADRDLIDVKELATRIFSETEKANIYNEGLTKLRQASDDIDHKKLQISALITEWAGWSKDEVTIQGPDRVGGLVGKARAIQDWLNIEANKPLPDNEMQKLRDDFDNATEINKQIEQAREYRQIDLRIANLRKSIEQADDDIKAKREEKAKRISERIRIKGLSYDIENECFLYNGFPFDRTQVNTASQLIAGLKIASMMLNELRILRLDASLVDNVEMEKVKEWAEQEDISLFIERVDMDGGPLQIIIQED